MARPRSADEYQLSERKRGRPGWVLHYRDDHDQRRVITALTARAALDKWKARLGQTAFGKAPRDSRPLSASWKMARGWLEHWMTGAERPMWSGAQLQSVREYVGGYILEHRARWAGLPLAAVTDDDIRDLLATVKREEGERRRRELLERLQKKARHARAPVPKELTPEELPQAELSDRTLLKLFGMLRVALEDAKRKHLIADNPARGMPHGFAVRPEARPILGGAETEMYLRLALARKANGNWARHYGPLLAFQLCTGCRLGESQAMKWTSVDWVRDEIRIEATASKVPKPSAASEGEARQAYQLRSGEEWITNRLIRKAPKTKRGKRRISIKGTLQRNILRELWQQAAPTSIRDWPDRQLDEADELDSTIQLVPLETRIVSESAAVELLEDFLADNPASKKPPAEVTAFLSSPVWTGPRGRAVGGSAARAAHREIMSEMAGDPRLVVHDLRHSAASRLGGVAGANLIETAAILGHSGLMEVLTYGHLVDTRRAEIAERDGAILGVDLDRESGFSLERWGDEAFYHHGRGEIVTPQEGGSKRIRNRR
jgi:integrase